MTKHEAENDGEFDQDKEIAAMQAKLKEMEDEAAKLREEDEFSSVKDDPQMEQEAAAEGDEGDESRQVYIGNLAPSVKPPDLQEFFKSCGTINRITILVDHRTGQSKGYAYMEFLEAEAVEIALGLNETEMMGRSIKVTRKRKNIPRYMLRGRGRGGYRGRGRFFSRGRGGYSRGRGGYFPRGRGGYRGRGGP